MFHVSADELAAGLAELDARLAHHRWLLQMATECGFDDLVAVLGADIADVRDWRDRIAESRSKNLTRRRVAL